jgi:Helix-turn-helix domain
MRQACGVEGVERFGEGRDAVAQVVLAHLQVQSVAATLRRMREVSGLTREQAAEVLSCTTSKIGDPKTGRSGAKPLELAALLDRYGISGHERGDLVEFARESQFRRPRGGRWVTVPSSHRRFLDLERQATSARARRVPVPAGARAPTRQGT